MLAIEGAAHSALCLTNEDYENRKLFPVPAGKPAVDGADCRCTPGAYLSRTHLSPSAYGLTNIGTRATTCGLAAHFAFGKKARFVLQLCREPRAKPGNSGKPAHASKPASGEVLQPRCISGGPIFCDSGRDYVPVGRDTPFG